MTPADSTPPDTAVTCGTPAALHALAERWVNAHAAERANAEIYIGDLCDALGVPRPRPAGSEYEFDLPVKITTRDGLETQGFIECYHVGRFVLEAKDADAAASYVALRKGWGEAVRGLGLASAAGGVVMRQSACPAYHRRRCDRTALTVDDAPARSSRDSGPLPPINRRG